jgi:hypothetical protein
MICAIRGKKLAVVGTLSFCILLILCVVANRNQIQNSDELLPESDRSVGGGSEWNSTHLLEGKQAISNTRGEPGPLVENIAQEGTAKQSSGTMSRSPENKPSYPIGIDVLPDAGNRVNDSRGMATRAEIVQHRASDGALEIWIPAQASVPAVLAAGAVELPSSSPLPSGVAASASPIEETQAAPVVGSLKKISQDFFTDVTQDSGANPVTLQEWENASWEADERFRSLRGHDAFLRYKLEAAKESLSSLKNP